MSDKNQDHSTAQTRVEKFTTTLKCALTEQELIKYAKEMADVNADVAQLEADLKSVQSEFKGKIAQKEARRSMLGQFVSTGAEFRQVDCERLFDFEKRVVCEVRMDGQTPTVINTRQMTDKELQQEIPFG